MTVNDLSAQISNMKVELINFKSENASLMSQIKEIKAIESISKETVEYTNKICSKELTTFENELRDRINF